MRAKFVSYCRKLGWAGLIFFTLKGLLWLAIPAAMALLAGD